MLRAGALRVDLSRIGRPPLALVVPPLAPGWRLALTAALEAAPGAPRELADGLAALRHGDADAGVGRARRARRRAHARRRRRRSPATRRGGTRRASRSRSTAARCSPLGLAYLRCAERGELPEPVAARAARDPRRRRGRGRAPRAGAVALGCELRRCHAVGDRGGSELVNEIGPNFIARPYRGVSVQDAPSLEPDALLAHVRSRRVYRRTEFIVAVHGDERALVQLEREEGDEILVGVRDARVLAGPDEVAFVVDASVDTGNASQLAARQRPRRARDRRRGPLPARQLHLRAGAAADPRRRGRPAAPAEAARHGAHRARVRRGAAAAGAGPRRRSTCASWRPRTRPSTTCSRAAARAWSSARRSTSSTPARPSPPTGRCSAASARARSTPRSTATTRTSGSTSARCWSRASRGRSSRCSSAACASAGSSGRARG